MTPNALSSLDEKKILYIHKAGSGWGGAQQGVFDMINHFRTVFRQVHYASNKCPLFDRIQDLGVQCHEIPISSVKFFPLTLSALGKLVNKVGPDIVHSNHRYASILYMSLKKVRSAKAPLLYTARSAFPDKTRFRMLGDTIVAVSESVKKNLIEEFKIPEDKIHVIYNGIELNGETIPMDENDPLFEQISRDSKIVIGSIGSLLPVKGHPYLFLAIQQLPKELKKKIKLLVVGDGPLRNDLETQVHQLGLDDIVTFAGYRKDIHRMIDICNFMVNSSTQEGLSRVVVEAYLRSKPVIATNLDYVKEVIIKNESGLVVPTKDCQSLSKALETYIRNPEMAVAHGIRGKSFISDRFSLTGMLKNYQNLYNQMIIQN